MFRKITNEYMSGSVYILLYFFSSLFCFGANVSNYFDSYQSLSKEELDRIFDGKYDRANDLPLRFEFSYNEDRFYTNRIIFGTVVKNKIINVPLPEQARSVFDNPNITDKEKEKINEAFELIRKYSKTGENLYRLKDRIRILWKTFNNSDEYASSVDGVFFFSPKILLNISYKDIFLTHPAYLAIILAHELSHHDDFQKFGNVAKNPALNYISEEKAYLTQIFMYETMLKNYPWLFDESKIKTKNLLKFVQIQRLYKAIWDYKNNNGKIIEKSDFFSLVPIFEDEDEKNFWQYIPCIFNINCSYEKHKNYIWNKHQISPYLEWLNFKHLFTFHGLILVGYPDIRDDQRIKMELRKTMIYDKFDGIKRGTKAVYYEYCNYRYLKPVPEIYLDVLPHSITPYTLEDEINSHQSEQSSGHGSDEISIDPGPPPSGESWNVDFDGSSRK